MALEEPSTAVASLADRASWVIEASLVVRPLEEPKFGRHRKLEAHLPFFMEWGQVCLILNR